MKENTIMYVAYGSNLNVGQMAYRCPGAKPVGKGTIENHQLVFRGARRYAYATIEPCDGAQVPVGLWKVSAENEAQLDRYEGYPTFYGKRDIEVKTEDGTTVTALVYIMNDGNEIGFPAPEYYATCLQGYKDFGLDRTVLEKAAEACTPKDERW